jgi:hypothetical protein
VHRSVEIDTTMMRARRRFAAAVSGNNVLPS